MKYSRIRALALPSALCSLLNASHAKAAVYGEVGVQVTTERSDDASATATGASSERHFRIDLANGWLTEISDEQTINYGVVFKTERGLQAGSELSGYGVGAFVAWSYGAFSSRLDYLALAELKANNGNVETQFREGAGYMLEARWLHWLKPIESGHRFGLGPSLAFNQMKYGKTRVGSLPESSSTRTTESLTPGIRAIFIF